MGRRGLWTGQHLQQISDQLGLLGLAVSPNTVRRLLQRLGYALRANRKSLSGPQSPHRDRQFRYPTGASKWNPVEHRLFSEITKEWSGQPLVSFEAIAELIRGTKTKTGLRVTCKLVRRVFPTAQKVSDAQMRLLSLSPHPILPLWNYTLSPK